MYTCTIVHCLEEKGKKCSTINFTHHQTRPSLQRIVTRLQLIWSKINVCSNNLSGDYSSSLELVSEWSPGTGAWYEYLNRPIIGPGLSSLRIPGQHLKWQNSTDFVQPKFISTILSLLPRLSQSYNTTMKPRFDLKMSVVVQ